MESLEARIRKLEDRAEIQDLVARYFQVTDDDDLAALAECFTDDARFVASGFVGGESRAGIMEFLANARAAMTQTVHTPHYVQIAFDGPDSATGTVMAHLEIGIGGTTVYGAVRYYDVYRRERNSWRIAVRDMRTVHLSSWDEMARSLVDPRNVRWPGAEPVASDFPRRQG
ncbi:MAG: nuclear transport factor 2 family protein [Pseudomonadota bacterium]